MTGANLARLGILGVLWGSSFLLQSYALDGLSPAQLVLGRLGFGAITLVIVVVAIRERLPREPRIWGHLALMGLVANVAPFWLFGYGQQRVTSGFAGVMDGTTPLFTLLFALAAVPLGWSVERLNRERVAGLLLGFVGTVMVIEPWVGNGLAGSLDGQLACLAAAACYGLGFVYTRHFLSPTGYSPVVLSAGQIGSATVLFGLAAPLVAAGPMRLTPVIVLSVVTLGALMTGLAYVLYFRLIADAGATSASMVTYLIPPVAVLLGAVLRDEPLGWNLLAGALVVLLGVALAEGRLRTVAGFRHLSPRSRSGAFPG